MGDVMRRIFILYALAFGLVTAVTAIVMATTVETQIAVAETSR
jgi:hypothetical protein